MNVAELIATLTLDSSGFDSGMSAVQSGLKASTVAMGNIMSSVIKGGARLMKNLVQTGYEYNTEIERYTTNFSVMLGGSMEKAQSFVEWMHQLDARTPFGLNTIADAGQELLQFGLNTDQAKVAIQQLGDISLGNSQRFNSLATVYGKVASQGKLTAQTTLQMIKAGFNPLNAIAQTTGKSMATLQKEMSQGKITLEMLNTALQAATSVGGQFYEGMAKGAETTEGKLSTLKDNFSALMGGLIEPFTNNFKVTILPQLISKVDELTGALLGVDNAADLNLPNVTNQLNTWLDDLMAEWTNGLKEDDSTVNEYVTRFKEETQPIKDAIQERINALSLEDDPEARVKLDQAKGMMQTLNQLYTDLDEILTNAAGRNFTPEEEARIRALVTQIESIQNALGEGGTMEGQVTPWQKFADAVTSLASASIDKIVSGIEWLANNGETAATAIKAITAAFLGFKALTFVSTEVNSIKTLVGLFSKGGGAAEGVGETVGDVVGNIAEGATDTAFDTINSIAEAVGKIGENSQSGAENLGAITSEIQKLTGSAEGSSNIAESLQAINEQLGTLGGESSGAAAENVRGIGSAVSDTLGSIQAGVGIAVSTINSGIARIGAGISGTVAGNIRSIGSAVNSTLSSIAAGVAAKVAAINAQLSKIGSGGFGGGLTGGDGSTSGGGAGRGRHETGFGYVPYDNYPTTLDKGEMVLTKAQAEEYRKGNKGGSAAPADIDYGRIGAEVARAMQGFSININGKRAASLMQRDIRDTQSALLRRAEMGYGR